MSEAYHHRVRSARRNGRRQRGAYTIVVVAVLGIITLVAVRTITVTTVDSIRLTNNTHASTEAFYAAEAAIAQGAVWLDGNAATDALWVSDRVTGTSLAFAQSSGASTVSRSYAVEFGFELNAADTTQIKIYGTASNGVGNSATVTQWYVKKGLINPTALDAPLTVAQCIDDVTGNPSVSVANPGEDTTIVSANNCANLALDIDASGSPNNRRYRNLNQNTNEQIVDDPSLDGSDIWNSIFTTSRAAIEAAATNDAVSNIYWIDSSNYASLSQGGKVWGSADSPVLIVVDDCHSVGSSLFLGNNVVWGLVFVESDASNFGLGTCDMNGLGAVDVNGSLIVNGDMSDLNANTAIDSAALSGVDVTGFGGITIYAVPGTWSDMEID